MNILYITGKNATYHSVRGIGMYTKQLTEEMKKYHDTSVKIVEKLSKSDDQWADIVHYTSFDIYSHTLKPARTAPTVVTIHDVTPLVFKEHFPAGIRGKFALHLNKSALQKVNAVITDSENSKRDIHRYLNIEKENIHVVYLAARDLFVPLSSTKLSLMSIKDKYSLPEKYILYVGDINWNKNVNGLVTAFAQIYKKYTEMSLVLVGKALTDDSISETQSLIKLIADKKLQNSVKRLGFVSDEDLVGIVNKAYCYIQPSFYEGFGLPVLEAMRCGTPVLSSSKGSLSEIVRDAGILFDPSVSANIVKAFNAFYNYSTQAKQRMIKKGIQNAKQFSWQKTAINTLTVYRKSIN